MKRAVLLTAVLLALPVAAVAQPATSPEERAGELVDEGNRHYNVAEYPEAIAAYKEAYKLVPEPLLLWNLAQAYRLAGDCTNALIFYKNYVREAPGGQFRAMADQRIPEMDGCAKKAPPPTGPGTDTGDTPPAGAGDPRVTDPLGDGGGSGDIGPAGPGGPPDAGAIDAPPPSSGSSLRVAGFALTGAGALGLVAGGYFSLKARSLASDAERECATGCTGAELMDITRRGEAADRNATIAYVAGGVMLAAGIATIVITRPGGERRATVSLVPTPGGATAATGWSF
jgi:tetratricopeptide (TPR) repeat protein